MNASTITRLTSRFVMLAAAGAVAVAMTVGATPTRHLTSASAVTEGIWWDEGIHVDLLAAQGASEAATADCADSAGPA